MKKITVTTLIILLIIPAVMTGALALVSPSDDFFVTDDAGVLTEATRYDIVDSNIGLMEKCDGAQIVIVTIKYLDGAYADEYANQLFNDWGVGSSGADNGMLLLLVTEELKGGLVVGNGISGVFNEKKQNEYLDMYFWGEVDARNFDTAVRNICEALFSWYAGYYGLNRGSGAVPEPAPAYPGKAEPLPTANWQPENVRVEPVYRPSPFTGILVAFWLIIFFVVIIVIIAAAGTDRRRHRAYYVHMGMPIPRYHWWYMWGAPRPYRVWYNTHNRYGRGPRGPRGPGGFGGPGGPPRGGGSNRSGGGFGGFGGNGSGRSGGGFGGFGGNGGGRSGGGFGGFGGGGHSGGGFSGGGGHSSGGFSGRR